MALRLYDSLNRTIKNFKPIVPGQVSIYICGATVQSVPHLGHIRSGVVFDILRRWLLWHDYDVLFVRNITDIDDKILVKAAEAQRPWWEWAATHERAFSAVYNALGILPPSAEPRATGYMLQIIEFIARLIDSDHAYTNAGDVYFNVASFPKYGTLSRQKIDEVQQGESAVRGKHDPRDFTLWKSAKPGEPFWNSPWGPGRPGWHIECSAMSRGLLGPQFDIHGGGMDLIFPHHENEMAQSHAAGDAFAKFWMHNGLITVAGEKMSKSLGNYISVPEILTDIRHIELRYYLSTTHYRSNQEFSLGAVEESAKAFRRIETFLTKCHDKYGDISIGSPTDNFIAALDNDLAVPEALAELHTVLTRGNQLFADNAPQVVNTAQQIRAMVHILGYDPFADHWRENTTSQASYRALDYLVQAALAERTQARQNRDYATADQIRDNLTQAGIFITDTSEGSSWYLEQSYASEEIYERQSGR